MYIRKLFVFMPKIKLKIKHQFDFNLIGIYSYATDYKLCWLINKELNYDFKKKEDLIFKDKKTVNDGEIRCSLYYYEYEKNYTFFYIFPNSAEQLAKYVIPEMKDLNYIFLIKGVFSEEVKKGLIQRLKKVPQIIFATEIKADSLTKVTKNNLLLAMEER